MIDPEKPASNNLAASLAAVIAQTEDSLALLLPCLKTPSPWGDSYQASVLEDDWGNLHLRAEKALLHVEDHATVQEVLIAILDFYIALSDILTHVCGMMAQNDRRA